MIFEIGHIFENAYPPEAALWCNESGKAYIEEISPIEKEVEILDEYGEKITVFESVRRFEIKTVPEPTEEELSSNARSMRDSLLADTDYLLMSDYPISQEQLELVKTYRQALRDIPQQEGFPKNIIWPKKPEFI